MSAPATCNATSLPERDRLREAELRILEWAEANAEDIERRAAKSGLTRSRTGMPI